MTVPEVLPLLVAYLRAPGNEAGGVLHIFTDDGNDSLDSIRFCARLAREEGDHVAEGIALLLGDMSRTQRRKLAARAGKEIDRDRNPWRYA